MPRLPDRIAVRVEAIRREAETVRSYELVRPDGSDLPPFAAGSHVDLELPGDMIRSYSLSNDQRERHRYVIGVNRDPNSRGGSAWLHEHVHIGQDLHISAPRNNFPLAEDAEQTVFIAGGIGITPILSMARRLTAAGREWRAHLAVRSRNQAAFARDMACLAADKPGRLQLHVDDEQGGFLDVAALVDSTPPGAHLYCCGPLGMMTAFEKAASDIPAARRHVEYFAATQDPEPAGGFEVLLSTSGTTLTIPPGSTILDALLDAGVDVPYSCGEGICGTCETRVVSGTPDHRDLVLTEAERESNEVMMICCSGSKSPRLVLER